MKILRTIIAIFALLVPGLSHAQTPQTKASLQSEINTNLPDNTVGQITPLGVRTTLSDMLASWQQFSSINAQTGTSYTILTTDYGKLVTFNNSGPVAVTLPQATGSFAVFNFFASNLGGGAVTITPQGASTINGQSALVLGTGQSLQIISDGTNYQIFGGGIGTSGVTSITNTDGTLAISPSAGNVVASLNPPTLLRIGGVKAYTSPSNQFITGISTAGAVTSAQPSATGLTGILPAANGGLGLNASSSTGVVQFLSGTATVTAALANGTTATTQTSTDNTTSVATDQFVQTVAQSISTGLVVHTPAALATTTALAANTYNNGSSGVGATLTANANGNLVIDGTTNPVATTRIVVKNEATAANNGIYVVTTTGGASQEWVLTRATDANTPGTGNPSELGYNTYAQITGGSTNINTSWVVNSTVTTIGTSAVNWVLFSAASSGVASIGGITGAVLLGTGLSASSQTINTPWTVGGSNITNNNTGNVIIGATTGGSVLDVQNGSGSTGIQQEICDESGTANCFYAGAKWINGWPGIGTNNATDFSLIYNNNTALTAYSAGVSIPNSLTVQGPYPYCDPRYYGAGAGNATTDTSAFGSVASACGSGSAVGSGHVFIPCGTYTINSTINWTGSVDVGGAGTTCVTINNASSSADLFTCSSPSGVGFFSFHDFTILGTGALTSGTVPTGGWAINCHNGGNKEQFYRLYVAGTYNGIYQDATNGTFFDNRLETLYGTLMYYGPAGGNNVIGNQFDNNSEFNATGGGGFGTWINYNTSSPVSVTAGTIAYSGGWLYTATVGGTTGPQGGGLPVDPMYKNITDGSVTWQLVGNSSLVLVWPGTETWIEFNDLTSPAQWAIFLDGTTGGHTGAKDEWIFENDCAGPWQGCVAMQYATTDNHIVGNQMFDVAYVSSGATTGWPIWDLGNGDNIRAIISNNSIYSIPDAAMLIQSDYWNINGNTIGHNSDTAQYCGIELFQSGGSPSGTTITGNLIFNSSPGQICFTGTGSSTRNTAVANTLFGGTLSLPGSSTLASPNN